MQASPPIAPNQKARYSRNVGAFHMSTEEINIALAAETEHLRKQWIPEDKYEACFEWFFGPLDSE